MKGVDYMKGRTKKLIQTYLVLLLLVFTWFGGAFQVMAKSSPRVIVIDPAFQEVADDSKEPVGPGAFRTSDEASSGNVGATTGYPEYELTLQVALKLKADLENAGYEVILTRSSNDVNISNSGRAMIANMFEADLFIVVSAKEDGNGSSGVQVVCQSEDNPYNYGNYEDGRLLSDTILGSVKAAGSRARLVEDDDMAVMNWCQAPSTVVEIGSLANEDEEEKLLNVDYQQELADGIAAGLDSYFTQR